MYTTVSEYNDNAVEKEPGRRSLKRCLRFMASIVKQPVLARKSMHNGPYDVIIVPGFPYHEEKGAGLILKARIKWAHYLVSRGIAKNVIFSGSAVYTPYIESHVMAMHAIDLGIPPEHVFCETKAEHSTENIVYSIRLAEALGFERIALATGPYQSAFLDAYIKDHSLDVSFLPVTIKVLGNHGAQPFKEIDPASAYVTGFVSLVARETREERFQGTLGNKIMEN